MVKKNKDTQSSESVENFLKAVYILQLSLATATERVSTNAISESLAISAPSVTDMAQRLLDDGLIDYQRYKGIRLTQLGETIALKVLRRHRLLELFLVQELGYPLAEVHEEAENMEHAVSDRFIESLAHKLGNPHVDPHGDPIPNQDGSVESPDLLPLTTLPVGVAGRVARFTTSDNAMLQYTLDKGFHLAAQVVVVHRDPFEGPLTLHLNAQEIVIGYNVADTIQVEQVN